jgi:pimeloyl-ACP methyl ester carboxylesterase
VTVSDRYALHSIDLGGAPFAVGEWRGDSISSGRRADGDPVLAIHGISSNHHLFGWTAALLPDTRLVAPDLRGRGGNVGRGGPFGIDAHARDALAVLDALDIERATVVGMSLGGFIATALAAAAPERVRNLLLVDGGLPMRLPLPDLQPEQLPIVFEQRLARLRQTWTSVAEYEEFFRGSMGALLDADDPLLDEYLAHDIAADGSIRLDGQSLLDDSADLFFTDVAERSLANLATPTRLLYAEWALGTGTPGAYTAEVVAEWAARLPAFDARFVPGTDHASIVMTTAGAAEIAKELRP